MDLRLLIRSVGKSPTTAQKLDFAKRRERLRARVDAFNRTAMNFMGRNIQQSIGDNMCLLPEEFDMDDELQIDDPLPTDSLDGNAPQALFADGAPAVRLTPAAVALAKAG